MKDYFGSDGKSYAVTDSCDILDPATCRNLDATIVALDGRTPDEIFGAPTPLDVVKFTDWHPDTCSCTVRYVWRSDAPESDRAHHPHRALRKCVHHGHHDAHHAHFTAVLAENRSKNQTVARAAESLGVPADEIEWGFGAGRALQLRHAKHGAIDLARLKN